MEYDVVHDLDQRALEPRAIGVAQRRMRRAHPFQQLVDLRQERRSRNGNNGERQIKVSVILGELTHQALALARIRDGIPAAERVRAALHQWQQDPQFRVAVDEMAAELRRERFANKASRSPAIPPNSTVTAS